MKVSPTIKAIGAYRVSVTDQHVEATSASASFAPGTPKSRIRQYLEGFVLVDFLVENALPDFNPYEIKQTTTFSRGVFDTTFLSIDGKHVLARPLDDLPEGITSFRVVVYLHDFREGQPLWTPYGDVAAPAVSEMPNGMLELALFPPGD
jgi:hypothetical protein